MEGWVRAFDSWMNSGVLVWAGLAAALLTPALALVHELGHAIVGLASTEGMVDVRVGRTPPRWRGRFGRLRLNISLLPARKAPAGFAKVYALQSRATKAVFILAGPVAHATAGAIVLVGGIATNLEIVTAIGAVIIFAALLNLVPLEHHGFQSDGALLLALVKTRNSDPIRALDGSSVTPWLRSLQETGRAGWRS